MNNGKRYNQKLTWNERMLGKGGGEQVKKVKLSLCFILN
jgi:hypothetical protein